MQMVKNDFKAPGGQRDPGEYLAAMIAFLDSKNGEVVTDEDITAAAERAIQTMIVHSDTWQNEHRPN